MRRQLETTAQRQERLAEIQRQVKAGTYETRERISAAIDALLDDFAGQSDGASGVSSLESPDERARPWPPK